VDQKLHVPDLHATALLVFGVDRTRLTSRSRGRDLRLTGLHGEVAEASLA
jgi:hypothetical protein